VFDAIVTALVLHWSGGRLHRHNRLPLVAVDEVVAVWARTRPYTRSTRTMSGAAHGPDDVPSTDGTTGCACRPIA